MTNTTNPANLPPLVDYWPTIITPEQVDELRESLAWAIGQIERKTCTHEETYRGGAIWTICSACGKKWADDEGGFKPYKEPAGLTRARELLASGSQNAESAPQTDLSLTGDPQAAHTEPAYRWVQVPNKLRHDSPLVPILLELENGKISIAAAWDRIIEAAPHTALPLDFFEAMGLYRGEAQQTLPPERTAIEIATERKATDAFDYRMGRSILFEEAQPTQAQGATHPSAGPDYFKNAARVRTHHAVVRYLMSNAHGRWDGAEKAQRHDELCRFYVAAVLGCDEVNARQQDEGLYQRIHSATQELTDNMDEQIGFPIEGSPDYDTLAPQFFERFHCLAMRAISREASAPKGEGEASAVQGVPSHFRAFSDLQNAVHKFLNEETSHVQLAEASFAAQCALAAPPAVPPDAGSGVPAPGERDD